MRAFVFLCVALVAFATAPSADADTCQLKLISSLPITESSDHLFVPVVIAGKQLRFDLELGDAYTGITAKEAKELDLSEVPMPSEIKPTIGDKPITKRVNVPVLQIDNATTRDLRISFALRGRWQIGSGYFVHE